MAHTACYHGHDMWNGNMEPVVWAFRVGFFYDFMKLHPDYLLDSPSPQIYDCTSAYPDEEPDCWYCDQCGCLTVFYSHYRIDFEPVNFDHVSFDHIKNWTEYIACRDPEFEVFQDFCKGKTPLEAVCEFQFQRRYMLSPDGSQIFGYSKDKRIVAGFRKVRQIAFTD